MLGIVMTEGSRPSEAEVTRENAQETIDTHIDSDGRTRVDSPHAEIAARRLADFENSLHDRFGDAATTEQIEEQVDMKHADVIGQTERDVLRLQNSFELLIASDKTDEEAISLLLQERRKHDALKSAYTEKTKGTPDEQIAAKDAELATLRARITELTQSAE